MQNFSSSSNFFGTVFFLIPQILLRRRSAQSEGRNPCVMFMMSFSVPPKKISPTKECLIFWTDRQTDRRTGILWKILGKLCFARLKLNLKTKDRFKLKTKLGFVQKWRHRLGFLWVWRAMKHGWWMIRRSDGQQGPVYRIATTSAITWRGGDAWTAEGMMSNDIFNLRAQSRYKNNKGRHRIKQ